MQGYLKKTPFLRQIVSHGNPCWHTKSPGASDKEHRMASFSAAPKKSVCPCPSTPNILAKTGFGQFAGFCEYELDITTAETS